jgi:phosphate/sulfate permease
LAALPWNFANGHPPLDWKTMSASILSLRLLVRGVIFVSAAIFALFLASRLFGMAVSVTNILAFAFAGVVVCIGQVRIRRLRDKSMKSDQADN